MVLNSQAKNIHWTPTSEGGAKKIRLQSKFNKSHMFLGDCELLCKFYFLATSILCQVLFLIEMLQLHFF